MASAIGWRPLMISSLRTRLLLVVSVLAIAAVVAVALTARQTTRVGFKRFQENVQHRSGLFPDGAAARVASLLEGRCCTDEEIQGAVDTLAGEEVLFVVDEQGRLVKAAGPGVAALSNIRTRLKGDMLEIDFSRGRLPEASHIALQLIGRIPGRIVRSDGTPALVYVIPIPSHDPPDDVFLGSVDRGLLIATAVAGVMVF